MVVIAITTIIECLVMPFKVLFNDQLNTNSFKYASNNIKQIEKKM